MINQIKYNSSNSVLSQFNPIASLKLNTRLLVNEKFIFPIIESFFSIRGGLDKFSELDIDKLQTEIEFKNTENFVQKYIYKEIIDEITKEGNEVIFKPKYVITFDEDLASYDTDENISYPYRTIFGRNWNNDKTTKTHIKYGVMRLGNAPILYYIWIDLQQLIRFIKTLPKEPLVEHNEKNTESEVEKRNKLFDSVIFEQQKLLRNANVNQKIEIEQEINRLESIKETVLEGQSGKLRINLTWNTTDDLDLHIVTPNGKVSYNNKIVEYEGVIGELDVDKNAGENIVSNPQENINFNSMPKGLHKIYVNFFSLREKNEIPFTITVIPENGEGRVFNTSIIGEKNNKNIATFEYKNGELEFEELL